MAWLRGLGDGWRQFWGLSWWAKGPVFALLALMLLITISVAAATNSEPTSDEIDEAVSNAVAETPTAEPTILTTEIPAPSPIETTVVVEEVEVAPSPTIVEVQPTSPPGPATTFGDGTHIVGQDITAGTYQTSGAGGGCYWARLSGFGGSLDEIISNQFADGPQTVTIVASDAGFESSGCGTWTKVQ